MDTAQSTRRSVLPASPASGWQWISLLTAALFAFHVNYVRFHLFTELHYFDRSTASTQTVDHHDDHPGNGEHDHDQHQPHPATEHQLHLVGKQQSPFVPVDFVLPETWISLTPPQLHAVCSLQENGCRPGESPPGPAQPRAPPTV